ncbi:hypothetical protein [Nocardiopsis coralliicola]
MADWLSALITGVALALLCSFYASWRATRLDRLHTRVETARAALEAALNRRAAVVLELSADRALEPASAVLLADAAGAAYRAGEDRELAESRLSAALRTVLEHAGAQLPAAVHAEVSAAAKDVLIARSFYNDAAAQTRQARAARLVRLLRLVGRAPLPAFFEMDDEPPAVRGAQAAAAQPDPGEPGAEPPGAPPREPPQQRGAGEEPGE